MRKWFAVLTAVAVMFGLSSGEALAAQKTKVMLSMAVRDQFLSNVESAVKAKAKQLNVELSVQDANNDINAQLAHVQTAAIQGFDAAIVNLVDTNNAEEIIAAAKGMKIVFVNRAPDEKLMVPGKVIYVGSNEFDAGRMQGEYLVKLFKAQKKTDINVVLFQGPLGLQATSARSSSAKKALADGGIKAKFVYEDTAEWDRAKAMDKFIQFMGRGVKYDAVISNNDDMALGVIEAMKSQTGKILAPVVGIDATAGGVEAVEAGEMACSVFQDAVGQGSTAVDLAVRMSKGEKVGALNWVPFELVIKENVQKYKGANKG